MIGTIQNIVPEANERIVVFYSISDDKKIIEENAHFSDKTPFNEIMDYIEKRKTQIENIPIPDYTPIIGEIIE